MLHFIPGGKNTSPSLMFLSLKLDIRGLNPQSSITLPLGVAINHLAKEIGKRLLVSRVSRHGEYIGEGGPASGPTRG